MALPLPLVNDMLQSTLPNASKNSNTNSTSEEQVPFQNYLGDKKSLKNKNEPATSFSQAPKLTPEMKKQIEDALPLLGISDRTDLDSHDDGDDDQQQGINAVMMMMSVMQEQPQPLPLPTTLHSASLTESEADNSDNLTELLTESETTFTSQQKSESLLLQQKKAVVVGANAPDANHRDDTLPHKTALQQAIAQSITTPLVIPTHRTELAQQAHAAGETSSVSIDASSFSSVITKPAHTLTADAVRPVYQTPLLAPFDSQQWHGKLQQQIIFLNRNQIQEAELHLHPAELGKIQIKMTLEADKAQLHFASLHGQVRQVLENALPELRQTLAQQGVQLTHTQVTADAFSFSSQDSYQQHGKDDAEHSAFSDNELMNQTASTEEQRREGNNRHTTNLISIFA